MGQNASHRAGQGAKVGGAVGVVVGAAAGILPGAALGVAFGGRGAAGSGCKAGAITGGTILGLPLAFIGLTFGAAVGTGEDICEGVEHLSCAVATMHSHSVVSRKAKRLRCAAKVEERSGIDMPREAEPLLVALVVAQRYGSLDEEQALKHATEFAVLAAEGTLSSETLAARAEQQARQILLFVRLRDWYGPNWSPKELHQESERIVKLADPELLQAVLMACSTGQPNEVLQVLPKSPAEVESAHLNAVLRVTLEKQRTSWLERFQHHFPGHLQAEYATCLDGLKARLSPDELWRGSLLLQKEQLPQEATGFDFESLKNPDVIEDLRRLLRTPSLLQGNHIAIETASACALPIGSSSSVAGVSFSASGPFQHKQTSECGQLQVEVLFAENVGSAEYRLGDALCTGSECNIQIYVEVSLDEGLRKQTRPVTGLRGGRVEFGERVVFPLGTDPPRITVRLFESRAVQSILRGDPLIGELCDHLPGVGSAEPVVERLHLARNGECQAILAIRCGVLAPESAYSVLEQSVEHSLATNLEALAKVLAQPRGLDMLMEARPQALVRAEGAPDVEALRTILRNWVRRLVIQISAVKDASNPDVSQRQARCICRGALEVVAACAPSVSSEEVVDLAVAWTQAILQGCAGNSAASAMDEAFLRRILAFDSAGDSGPASLVQLGLGTKRKLSPTEEAAVVGRLNEAQANDEDEMFTGEKIFNREGRVRDGISAVLRRSAGGAQACHVFLYDSEGIQRWLQGHGSDPMTREHLGEGQIVELTSSSLAFADLVALVRD
mmetsp:Transcript_48415/g.123196  ORF Transcript_48415/g.123196 Transcript_48415/m.123196 type:complete len:786 (+) Transcript_48415:142-2499(+)